MKTLYAVAPDGLPGEYYLTSRKKYRVLDLFERIGVFRIVCDTGSEILCQQHGCNHLYLPATGRLGSWAFLEEEDEKS